ncbi:MAG: metallophosphoesterase [Acidobacteriales bacterium]|nr:metallophosphoesterase [Terriglobales bacterium]
MPRTPKYSLYLVLVTIVLTCACGTESNNTPAAAQTFPVVVFSDFHFNPLDQPSLCSSLASANVAAWQGLLEGPTALPAWHSDTNYPLLVLALSDIKRNLGNSPMVIFAGDLLVHQIANLYYQDCKGLTPEQEPSPQDVLDMQAFANKTATFVMQQVRASMGTVPVMFVVGNNDSYTGAGPDSTFLSANVASYYANFIQGSPADYPAFYNTFTAGGYYAVQPLGTNLKIVALNSNLFAAPYPPGVPTDAGAAYAELNWLDDTLASAQAAGQKVWLLLHVPPGANTVAIANGPSQITAKEASTTPVMMWEQDYQQSFLQILEKYPGALTLNLGGHTHRDEFRILSSTEVLHIVPSISPYLGNDPAFEIYTVGQTTLAPTDYRSLNYNLATQPPHFTDYYTFSTAYSMTAPLDSAMERLYPELRTNSTKRAMYMGNYNSGNNSGSWNPITDTNWPIFACGIGVMAQTDYTDCVNSY